MDNGRKDPATPSPDAGPPLTLPLTPLVTDPGPSAGPLVMLIDDDPDCRMLVRDALLSLDAGVRVVEAADGCSALKLLGLRPAGDGEEPIDPVRPALIFMDVEMPHMDGLETLAHLRGAESLRLVPVVMMTGVKDEGRISRAAALGANSYTVKPTDAGAFLDMVERSVGYWLSIHRRPQGMTG